ncbi:hypothetical protein V6Z11_A08G277900 [Gossypium hirsutum]
MATSQDLFFVFNMPPLKTNTKESPFLIYGNKTKCCSRLQWP